MYIVIFRSSVENAFVEGRGNKTLDYQDLKQNETVHLRYKHALNVNKVTSRS